MRIDLATESLDFLASLIINNRNLNQSRLIYKNNNKITTKIKTNLTIQLITKFESQNLRVDHGLNTINVFYYDISIPFQTFSLSLCVDLELMVLIC
jgi:hypothetical protein